MDNVYNVYADAMEKQNIEVEDFEDLDREDQIAWAAVEGAVENLERENAELAEALVRVLMWAPKSTEDACEQDYENARTIIAKLQIERERRSRPYRRHAVGRS